MRRHIITERTWLEVTDTPDGPEGVLHVLAPEGHVSVTAVDVFLMLEGLMTRACEGSPEALRTYSRLVHQLRKSEQEHEQANELAAVLVKRGLLVTRTGSDSAAEATATGRDHPIASEVAGGPGSGGPGGSPEIDIEQDGRSS